jgi:hypothetical protein
MLVHTDLKHHHAGGYVALHDDLIEGVNLTDSLAGANQLSLQHHSTFQLGVPFYEHVDTTLDVFASALGNEPESTVIHTQNRSAAFGTEVGCPDKSSIPTERDHEVGLGKFALTYDRE